MRVTIPTAFDLTPAGKRTARQVGNQLRWYVGGRIFRRGAPAHLTSEWLANEGAPDHLPQPREYF
jgi:hypothetical protein